LENFAMIVGESACRLQLLGFYKMSDRSRASSGDQPQRLPELVARVATVTGGQSSGVRRRLAAILQAWPRPTPKMQLTQREAAWRLWKTRNR